MSKEIDIQVGDRVTFKNRLEIIIYANNMKDGWKKEEIIKVERIGQNDWYIVEEKKELLTDEEREFLKEVIKDVYNFSGMRPTKISVYKKQGYSMIWLSNEEHYLCNISIKIEFSILREKKNDESKTLFYWNEYDKISKEKRKVEEELKKQKLKTESIKKQLDKEIQNSVELYQKYRELQIENEKLKK